MSYTNAAGQLVDIGCRVAYAGYYHTLTIGKVVSFTDFGSPRVEVEGKTVDWVRNRYNHRIEFMKHAGANIWARRPGTHLRHKETGQLITWQEYDAFPRGWESDSPRHQYGYDDGLLDQAWIEFTKPYVVAIVRKQYVVVIEGKHES